MALMLVGSAGVITVIATLLLSFVGTGAQQASTRILVLLGGLVLLFLLARSQLFDRLLSRLIRRARGGAGGGPHPGRLTTESGASVELVDPSGR